MSAPLRVANCSGFYGDRLSAAREMVEGGPIDVLTGDYLAELTLMILQRDRARDPRLGYARTFLTQLEDVAVAATERGIRIVVNAGGLNPAACADAARALYQRLGLHARVAHVEGDDLLPRLDALRAAGEAFVHLDKGMPLDALDSPILSANAYLGAWGIALALRRDAQLVICPRVTDAALVLGPAAWHHGWARDDWDRLAAGVVAGHILECGAQCTGGNYAFFDEVPGLDHPGFPLAEISADGSFVVTKHPGTGGLVSIGTVTAQLLYEIAGPDYPSPDVTARFDTIELEQLGPDRVRVSGIRGVPPPATTKVCINHHGGYRNQVTFVLTGLDLDRKAHLAEQTFWKRVGGRDHFAETRVTLHDFSRPDPATESEASAHLTLAAKDPDPQRVGRAFSSAAVEMALASYPGFYLTAPPGREQAYGVYWPAAVSAQHIQETVVFDDATLPVAPLQPSAPVEPLTLASPERAPLPSDAPIEAPLGRVCGARSGDKGGNANLGVWARTPAAYAWLEHFLTCERLRELLPETRTLELDRYALPRLYALNFVLHGFLGDGVAASLRSDAQAKSLGEYLRAKLVPIPRTLLPRTEA